MICRYLSALRISLLSLSFCGPRKPQKIAFDSAMHPLVCRQGSRVFYGSETEFSAFRPVYVLTAAATPSAILKMAN